MSDPFPPEVFDSTRFVLKLVDILVENHTALGDSLSFQQQRVDIRYTPFPKLGTTGGFTKCIGSQLYNIMKCYELVAKSGRDYDIYVRLRADSVFQNFENLLEMDTSFAKDDAVLINGSECHKHPMGGKGRDSCDREFGDDVRKHEEHT